MVGSQPFTRYPAAQISLGILYKKKKKTDHRLVQWRPTSPRSANSSPTVCSTPSSMSFCSGSSTGTGTLAWKCV
uniref:Uncharacterized protein n=1 Tax=Hyaloperonospora arabidopsidis (strain Emoy2) TaxID=559515 RepID=M4B628_HYAAE